MHNGKDRGVVRLKKKRPSRSKNAKESEEEIEKECSERRWKQHVYKTAARIFER